MAIHFRSILSRLTGISTPVFGISWNPPTDDRAVAVQLMDFLEDRRFLFSPFEGEDAHHVIASVLTTRENMTRLMAELSGESYLQNLMQSMRGACRQFIDNSRPKSKKGTELGFGLVLALGELRAQFGFHIAQLSAAYGIDVPDAIAGVLPPLRDKVGSADRVADGASVRPMPRRKKRGR